MLGEALNVALKPRTLGVVVNGGKRLAHSGKAVVNHSRARQSASDLTNVQHSDSDTSDVGSRSKALTLATPDRNLTVRQYTAKINVLGLTIEVPVRKLPMYFAKAHIQPIPSFRDVERLGQQRFINQLLVEGWHPRKLDSEPVIDILSDPVAVRIDLDKIPQTQEATKKALTTVVQSFDLAQTMAALAVPLSQVPHRAYRSGARAIDESLRGLSSTQRDNVKAQLESLDPTLTGALMTTAIDAATKYVHKPSDMTIIESFLKAYHGQNTVEMGAILTGLRSSGHKRLAGQLDELRTLHRGAFDLALGVAAYKACQLLNQPEATSYSKGLAIAELTILAAGMQATKPGTQLAFQKAAVTLHASVGNALALEHPKPNGMPVTSSLDLRMRFGKTAKGARLALDAMNRVHGLGDLSALKFTGIPIWRLGPIDSLMNKGTRGWIVCDPVKPWIQLNPYMANAFPESTLPHEVGHLWDLSLDHSVPKGKMASHVGSALISPVMQSLFDTPEVMELVATKKKFESLAKSASSPEKGKQYENLAEYFEYLTTPTEVFARYYAQYIGHESDSAVIMGQIDEDRHPNTIDSARQWSDTSFQTVRPEMIALMKKAGFLV